MLLAFADAHVQDAAATGGGTRGNAHDQLLVGALGTGTQTLTALVADQVAVDVGVGAEFLNEVNLDRDGALDALVDDVQALGAEADLDLSAVLGGQCRAVASDRARAPVRSSPTRRPP